MSEKRFELAEDGNGLYSIFDNEYKEDDPLIYGARFDTEEIVDLLNELAEENEELQKARMNDAKEFSALYKQNYGLKRENEQLRKQIQNYEQLISNSYVGEEERLDGFVGKYVIWEDELQKYRKKSKNEMIDNE